MSGLAGAGAGLGLASTSGGPAAAVPVTAGRPRTGPHDWQAVPAPECTPAALLLDVAAAGPGLAWAVGEEGRNGATRGTPVALRWDGTAWTRTSAGSGAPLHSVAAAPDGTAWAVGGNRLLSWDGQAWQEADFPGRGASGTSLTGVTTGPRGHVWLSGRNSDGCVLLHGHRGRWTWVDRPPSGTTATPSGVTRTPCGDVWVYGVGIVARWNGDAWTELPGYQGLRASVTGLLPVADDDLWLIGYDYGVGGPPGKPPGVLLLHGDGSTWESAPTRPFGVGMLTGIVGDAQGQPDRISGWDFWDQNRAHYLRWENGTWVSERGPAAETPVLIHSLAGVPGSPGAYWAAGMTTSSPYPPAQVRIER
ncbi:hypothetical protein H8R17_03820 [Streptomyces sp. TRM68367]|nr:hypothetical protein [Streptomyces sp. TRM68367]